MIYFYYFQQTNTYKQVVFKKDGKTYSQYKQFDWRKLTASDRIVPNSKTCFDENQSQLLVISLRITLLMGCTPSSLKAYSTTAVIESKQTTYTEKQLGMPKKEYCFINLKTSGSNSTKSTLPATKQPIASKKQSCDQFKVEEFQGKYGKAEYYYDQHKIDHARSHAKQLFQQFGPLLHKVELVSERRQICLKMLRKIEKEHQDVSAFNQQIYKSVWTQQSNKNGVKVSTREDGNTVGTMIQSEIDIPFQDFVAVMIEIELYQDFTPFMVKSSLEKKVARNCRIGFSANKVPLLTVRQSFFQGMGYNRLDHDKTLFMFTRSIENRKDLQEEMGYTPVLNPDSVQLEYKYFVLKYEPIARGRGKVTIAINADMKVSMIPMFLLNFLAVKFGNDFFEKVLEMSRNFKGSEWERLTKEDSKLHEFFKITIDQYLTNQGL